MKEVDMPKEKEDMQDFFGLIVIMVDGILFPIPRLRFPGS